MRKVLPIQTPSVAGYKRYAHFLAIMENDPASVPWIYNHFLQLHTEKAMEQDIHWLSFYMGEYYMFRHTNNPFLYYQEVEVPFMSTIVAMDELIRRCIDRGQYVFIECDCFYLTHSGYFEQTHRRSQVLVIGYDPAGEQFIVMDYSSRNNQYEAIEMSAAQLLTAAKSAYEIEANNRSKMIIIEQVKDASYPFNLDLAYHLLEDYLLGRNTYERFPIFSRPRENAVYGIRVYDELRRHIGLMRANDGKVRSSLLPYHILWEHKKCLSGLVDYLVTNKQIEERPELQAQLNAVEKQALLIRNAMLRYFISDQNERLIASIDEKLDQLQTSEAAALEQLLAAMRQPVGKKSIR
ncbi:hypothetical protein PCCS19_29960 [Paenibacillus sp. CCS19]|uniref:hypothetical protein n=1 Tax=Paenibacillus sp. CCS19 TaxID=3158387 RepID=UPI00255FA002|nr:hypothetical protein [Paenibacillus cellulosilyticus]GMK39941.1 hypothetical protein PCCS19_29960 [Paenibacillus cellulosilyticus]